MNNLNKSIKANVLIISLGSIGQRHLRNIKTLLPNATIAVLRQHNKGSETIEGVDYIFTDIAQAKEYAPSLIIVASPASHHVENTKPFLQQADGIFIEKPLATDAEDITDFVKSAEQSDTFTMVGYVLRFSPALQKIKQLIETNEIGEIYSGHIQVGQYLPDWRPDSDYKKTVSAQRKLGGGPLLELSHEIDYATWLFGMPKELYCSCRKLSSLDIDVEDNVELVFSYEDGSKIKELVIHLDFLQRVAKMRMQLVGQEATLVTDLIKEEININHPDEDKKLHVNCAFENGNEIYLRQFDYFLYKSLEQYTPVFEDTKSFKDEVTVNHASEIMNIINTARQSNKLGQKLSR